MQLELRDRRPEDVRNWLAGVAAVLLIGAGVAWLHAHGVSACVFRRVTGLPCLTCGTTRAAGALLKGDWVGAVRLHPLAVIGGLGACCVFAAHSVFLLMWRRVMCVNLTRKERRSVWAGVIVLAVMNWLYVMRCGL